MNVPKHLGDKLNEGHRAAAEVASAANNALVWLLNDMNGRPAKEGDYDSRRGPTDQLMWALWGYSLQKHEANERKRKEEEGK